MRLGFSNVYAWRPHVEHIHFLSHLAKQAGHEVSFLSCDSDLSWCYAKALHPLRTDFLSCIRCQIGGIRSYEGEHVHSIGMLSNNSTEKPSQLSEWGLSSAATLARFETESDFSSTQFHQMAAKFEESLYRTYNSAVNWIERERLDGVCVFNGRIDATRAIMEAARHKSIPFVSVERTLFGDGLQLLPGENCLGLSSIDKLVDDWKDKPLSRTQALKAASHVATRFLRINNKEWRAYNQSAVNAHWPVSHGQRRILILPSSQNEFWGHPDWKSQWPDSTSAFDALIVRLNLKSNEVILRCHPNWAERIGSSDGHKSEEYYTAWAKQRGIYCIPSIDKTSTLSLIEQCDAIVINGSSAAIEAGILGKQVIATQRSFYARADFQSNSMSPDQLNDVSFRFFRDNDEQHQISEHIARQVLRFVYTMAYRIPQYVAHVHCVTTTRYAYYEGADPNRFTQLFHTGTLQADDSSYPSDTTQETEILALIRQRQWQALLDATVQPQREASLKIHRRWMFRPVDGLRDLLRRGDL